MLATPVPDAAERRDNAAFAAILAAFARPGTLQRLPEAGPLTIARALLDRECRVHAADPALAAEIALTGAAPAPVEAADHAFLPLSRAADLAAFARLNGGSQLYPDAGATVVVQARIGGGQRLGLTGPGIAGTVVVALDGLHPGLWPARRALGTYPLGVEMIVVDGASILALPRSTVVEVL